MTGPLRELLAQEGRLVVAAELVTSRGLLTAESGRELLALARDLSDDPRVDVLSITDNPGGHAMLAPDALGTDLISRGQEVIIHLACKDWNRNALESRAWQLGSEGFHNILALSGDYPREGFGGRSRPVFDIDSVGLLRLLRGLSAQGLRFTLGCAVNPFKATEADLVPQLLKLAMKARAGAGLAISQVGFDAFALAEGRDIEAALAGLGDFSDGYQLTQARTPWFRRRNGSGATA